MRSGPLEPRRVARLVRQLGGAIAEVHARGVVHRDLKPENLILLRAGGEDELPVLIDFGTAAFRGNLSNGLACTTVLAGSFQYVPPERLTGYYSPATDIYSLAVIVLEMLTGRPVSDLGAVFSDVNFLDGIRNALAARLPAAVAARVADRLHPGYDPVPHRRPANIAAWTLELADLLERAAYPSRPAIQRSS